MDNKSKLLFPKAEAYWISPEGIINPVFENHISMVCDNSELFGFLPEEITDIFNKENEPLKFEGKARKKIILIIIKKGWIRIRKYYRPDRWSVNVPDMSDQKMLLVRQWASQMIEYSSLHDTVHIDSPESVIETDLNYLSGRF